MVPYTKLYQRKEDGERMKRKGDKFQDSGKKECWPTLHPSELHISLRSFQWKHPVAKISMETFM